ncbi:MAG: alanine racemase [Actinomycetota bacterium]|jgi:alanine racemase
MRWVSAEIDVDAVHHNVAVIRDAVAPAAVWAVVKANGYGHGAVDVARAAIAAGAEGLCVALVDEGLALRTAGIGVPILVLSEQPVESVGDIVDARLTPTVYHPWFLDALADAVESRGIAGFEVHLKVDTGMRRVGAEPVEVGELLRRLSGHAPTLGLGGVFTHLACADDAAAASNAHQLDMFDDVVADGRLTVPSRPDGTLPAIHVANSAAAITSARSRRSFVRCGIALYGISPGPAVDDTDVVARLRPVMRLVARVSHVKRVGVGEHVSYGWRYCTTSDTVLATVPIGYADGVPRRLGAVDGQPGAEVLIGGRRRPIVGVVTMDQLVVDVGDDEVAVGDEVVLIGSQGDEVVRVEEWAELAGTIGYEIVCGISARVPRRVTGFGDRP